MRKWKIGALIAVAAIAGLAILAASKTNSEGITGMFTGLSSGISDVLQKSVNPEADIKIEAGLAFKKPIELSWPADDIKIDFKNTGAEWFVGNEKLTFSNLADIAVEIESFSGKISIDKTLTISGTCDKFFVNNVNIKPKESQLNINVAGLSFDKIKISNIVIDTLSQEELNGKIDVDNKVQIALENESLEIQNYIGNIEISGENLAINGTISQIRTTGTIKTLINK